jgi:hypothetical protein
MELRLTLGVTDHNLQLTGFADADRAHGNFQRKSLSGNFFTLGRGPGSYKSKQQTCVALSTLEAEHYSAANATKEGLHLRQLMGEVFDEPVDGTTTMWEDNHSAIAYSQNALVSEKTKSGTFSKTTWNKELSNCGTCLRTGWWPTISSNPCLDIHSQDTEVPSWEDRTKCSASSRSYLQGEYCNQCLLAFSHKHLQ